MENLYGKLGLQSNSSSDEIKNAYRQLSKVYHPDKIRDHSHKKLAEKYSTELTNAKEIQSNPYLKVAYDYLGSEGIELFVRNKEFIESTIDKSLDQAEFKKLVENALHVSKIESECMNYLTNFDYTKFNVGFSILKHTIKYRDNIPLFFPDYRINKADFATDVKVTNDMSVRLGYNDKEGRSIMNLGVLYRHDISEYYLKLMAKILGKDTKSTEKKSKIDTKPISNDDENTTDSKNDKKKNILTADYSIDVFNPLASSVAITKPGEKFSQCLNFSMGNNGIPIMNHSTTYNLRNRVYVFGTTNLFMPRFFVSTSGSIIPKLNWSCRAHINFYQMSLTNSFLYSYSDRLTFRLKHKTKISHDGMGQSGLVFDYKYNFDDYLDFRLATTIQNMAILSVKPSIMYYNTKFSFPITICVLGAASTVGFAYDALITVSLSLVAYYLRRKQLQRNNVPKLKKTVENEGHNLIDWENLKDQILNIKFDQNLSSWNLTKERLKTNGLVVLGAFIVDRKFSRDSLLDKLEKIRECSFGMSTDALIELVCNVRKLVQEGKDLTYCLDITALARTMVINSELDVTVQEIVDLSLNCCKAVSDCPELIVFYMKNDGRQSAPSIKCLCNPNEKYKISYRSDNCFSSALNKDMLISLDESSKNQKGFVNKFLSSLNNKILAVLM